MAYDRLIDGYVAHAQAVAHEEPDHHFWAYRGLHSLVEQRADAGWDAVVEVIARVHDEVTLNYIGADILEDLLCAHPTGLIDRVEAQAQADDHFRSALRYVWGWSRMPAEVKDRLNRACGGAATLDERGRPTKA